MRTRPPLLALLLFAASPAAGQAPLTLREAFARVDRASFAVRAADAEVEARRAAGQAALRGILPGLRAEAGWVRTTDPLAAFGVQLRQRVVTQSAFDPALLNDPVPRSNLGTGVVLEVPLLNPDAWLGRSAAGRAAEAAEAGARWTRAGARLELIRAYYGGILTGAQTATLEAGLEAARSHVRQAQALREQGMVTNSDVLRAEVRAGQVEAQLLAARGDRALAVRRVATLLGAPDDTLFALPAVLPDPGSVRALQQSAVAPARSRADVAAARLAASAADRDLQRATSLLLPRVNSFARYDWNAAGALAHGRPSWTVGVMASWSVFSGASELSERRAAQARRQAAVAMAEAAEAQATLELEERRTDLSVALSSLGIAQRNVGQSVEAHRIVTRMYEGGLATITDLLGASAEEIRAGLELSAALYEVVKAAARWRVAAGLGLDELTVLDERGAR